MPGLFGLFCGANVIGSSAYAEGTSPSWRNCRGNRLGELTTRFELEVADRRSVEAHVDAIVRKRALEFREVLEVLRREELQGACEALGLDAGGRDTILREREDVRGVPNAGHDRQAGIAVEREYATRERAAIEEFGS